MLVEVDKFYLPHLQSVQATNRVIIQARDILGLGFSKASFFFPFVFKLQSLVARPMGT